MPLAIIIIAKVRLISFLWKAQLGKLLCPQTTGGPLLARRVAKGGTDHKPSYTFFRCRILSMTMVSAFCFNS